MSRNAKTISDSLDTKVAWANLFHEMVNGAFATCKSLSIVPPVAKDATAHGGTVAGNSAEMASILERWQAFFSSMAAPESAISFIFGLGAAPDFFQQMAKSSLRNFMQYHNKAAMKADDAGKSKEGDIFKNMDKNLIELWNKIYERELKPLLNVPQLGLTRFYQEHWNQAVDKFNIFQNALSELSYLLALPFQQALADLKEKIDTIAETGDLPENLKDYYQIWLSGLEGHFMALFNDHEYVFTLSKTVTAMAECIAARNTVFEEMIGTLPIARRSELDEMAREMHELKKRNQRLEKQIEEIQCSDTGFAKLEEEQKVQGLLSRV